jgi:cytochrome c
MSKTKLILVGGVFMASLALAQTARFSLGRPATSEDLRKHGNLVGPSGQGLPKGSGSAVEGKRIYEQQCAACHGLKGEGTNEFSALVGGRGTLATDKPVLTVGSYWPYATTIWDYVNRAMPYQSAGTLKPDDVYAVTAYILALNGIVSDNAKLDETTLPKVKMPNRHGFVTDPRPDVK